MVLCLLCDSPVKVDTLWWDCCPRSLRFPGESTWRGWGSTSRAPGTSPRPSWREKADWESRWVCGGQEGGERRAGGGEEEGEEAGWDSLTVAEGFRVKKNSELGVPLWDWGPLVTQGDNAGFQDIRLWLAEKIQTGERKIQRGGEGRNERRNIRMLNALCAECHKYKAAMIRYNYFAD